jgi:hypothetical protein
VMIGEGYIPTRLKMGFAFFLMEMAACYSLLNPFPLWPGAVVY